MSAPAENHNWTPEQDRFIIENQGKMTFPEIGRRLGGLSKHQIRGRYLRLKEKWVAATAASGGTPQEAGAPPEPDRPAVSVNGSADAQTVSVSRVTAAHQEGALQAALEEAKIDTEVWEVERWEAKRYEGFFRDSSFPVDPEARLTHWKRTATVVAMWSVKVSLKRRQPSVQEDMASWGRAVIREMKANAPRPRPVRYPAAPDRQLMAELSLPDLHAGKLAWSPETGNNYDTPEAAAVFLDAVGKLLGELDGKPITEIMLPVGSDFFHIDTPEGTTTAGTRQDSDTRWQKTFLRLKETVIAAVEMCREIAPTHVHVVPGNHDYNKTFFFGDTLASWFHNTPGVKIHNSPFPRKYHLFGCVLIGLTHGDQESPTDLPTTMALEVPELWARARHREWHTGHFHKMAKRTYSGRKARVIRGAEQDVLDYPAEACLEDDTRNAVVWRSLPSLSATDAWHARRGYVKGPRAAQCYLWDHEHGYAGHINYAYWGTKAGK